MTLAAVCTACLPVFGQQKAPAPAGATSDRIRACSLLTKAEAKKLLQWPSMLDQLPIEEEPLGTTGSSCNYPNAHVQVMAFTPQFAEAMRKQGKLEPVSGVGDEAFFRENRAGYAEVYVQVGQRVVTVQKDVGPQEKMESAKATAVALASALIAKLR